MTEGMELTRGTKKIIQEAIDTVDTEHKSDRLRLCEAFCDIVEQRYAGQSMSYQLRRMGNTYPFDLLSENGWTIQDAIENDLTVYLSDSWFMNAEFGYDNDCSIWKAKTVMISPVDGNDLTLNEAVKIINQQSHFNIDDLHTLSVKVVKPLTSTTHNSEIKVWELASEMEQHHLEEKLLWLSDLVVGHSPDGSPIFLDNNTILNLSKNQVKARGFSISKENNIKVPLNSTAPILEAIDKYLYDKTGQYVM